MNLPRTLVADCDGTILDITGIRDWTDGKRSDYHVFHALAANAPPIHYMAESLRQHWDAGYDVVILTARSEFWRGTTIEWLTKNNIPFHKLVMRSKDDERSDAEVKLDRIRELQKSHDIRVAFEDKPDIVKIWDYLGVPCWIVTDESANQ